MGVAGAWILSGHREKGYAVMSFDIKPQDGLRIIYDEIGRAYPEYSINIIPDVDVSG